MKTKRTLLYIAFAVGAFLVAMDGGKMLLMLFDPEIPGSQKEWLGFGAMLAFGWAVLLLASMIKPFERRFVLLVTVIAMIGNVIIIYVVNNMEPFQLWYYWFSMIAPGAIGLFYIFVFFFSIPAREEAGADSEKSENDADTIDNTQDDIKAEKEPEEDPKKDPEPDDK